MKTLTQAVDSSSLDQYPNVKAWLGRMTKEIEHYDKLNGEGARLLGQMIHGAMKKSQ